MAVYFQKISDDQFNASSDFVAKESKGVNLVIGIFFLILAFAFVFISWYGWLMVISVLAIVARGFRNKRIMVINKNGFYYYGELLTDWDHFISEEFIDDGPSLSWSPPKDQFYVLIKYYKEGQSGYYGRKVSFTNSQDKSEEEIIAAIKFYYNNHEKEEQKM
jgi:hypothetical protein